MQFSIKTIPHSEQKYSTCGDYWEEKGVSEIRVSELGNDDYNFLILIHELLEQYLCKKKGIEDVKITAFDMIFENIREIYPATIGFQEPGDMVSAPYFKEHQFATKIEKLLAKELSVDWKKYEKLVDNL